MAGRGFGFRGNSRKCLLSTITAATSPVLKHNANVLSSTEIRITKMKGNLLSLVLLFTGLAFAQQGHTALLHVTQVKHPAPDKSEKLDDDRFEMEHKVWGYTDKTEYVLSCYETWKVENGSAKIELPCAPMNAGGKYTVKVFSKAILYPADQPNQPIYGWYMIREEREKPSGSGRVR